MAANRVDVGRERLESAFRQHRAASSGEGHEHSRLLLFVYAIECGLYAVLMRARGILHTSKLAAEDSCGHDLDRLIGQVRRATGLRGSLPSFMAEYPKNEVIQPVRLHSLLRYGGILTPADRTKLSERLTAIAAEIEEHFT